jgi:hypothetical protein
LALAIVSAVSDRPRVFFSSSSLLVRSSLRTVFCRLLRFLSILEVCFVDCCFFLYQQHRVLPSRQSERMEHTFFRIRMASASSTALSSKSLELSSELELAGAGGLVSRPLPQVYSAQKISTCMV